MIRTLEFVSVIQVNAIDCLCIQHHLPTAADYLLTEAQLSGQLCYTAVPRLRVERTSL